jgi:imidazolonepropionase-like amidohydrolase
VVTGTNGHVTGRTADGPWEVRKAVREMVEQKADFIKTAATGGFASPDEETWWVDYTYEELEALVDEAHSVGRLVVVHAHSQPGLTNAIRAGCDQIHHGALIDEEALQGIKEKGLCFVPTLRVTSQRNIEVKEAAGRPWESRKMRETGAVHRAGVRRAHELGITMGLGTDLPSTAPWDAGDSAIEITELVACGLTPLEALGVATKGSARCMRLDDRLGALEAGKIADVVVVDGDPSEDAGVLLDVENVRQVMKDGRLVVDRDRGFFGPVPQHRGAAHAARGAQPA